MNAKDKETEKDFNSVSKNKQKKGSNRRSSSSRQSGKSGRSGSTQNSGNRKGSHSYAPSVGDNDVSWYTRYPQLVKDTANLSFGIPLGAQFSYGSMPDDGFDDAIPGVMNFLFAPVPGANSDPNSPMNAAAAAMYSYIRAKISGNYKNYTAQDLMIYCLAMDSVYMMLQNAARAYGVARTFSQTNRYLPEQVIDAMGFKSEEVLSNMASFREKINSLILKANRVAVPDGLPFFKRHNWMVSGVYLDSPTSLKNQIYMFTPSHFHYYSATQRETGGSLVAKTWVGPYDFDVNEGLNSGEHETRHNIDEWFTIVNAMLNRIILDDDMNLISGDILKAYDGNLITFAMIAEDYTVIPTFSMEVLSQIQNCTITGWPKDIRTLDIVQVQGELPDSGDPGAPYLECKPVIATRTPVLTEKILINLPLTSPTPEDVMVATRMTTTLTNFRDDDNITGHLADVEHSGAEIIMGMNIIGFSWKAGGRAKTVAVFESGMLPQDVDTYVSATMLSKFDYHPTITYCRMIDGQIGRSGSFVDTQNIALCDHQTLANIHDVAMWSLFAVPGSAEILK